MATVKETIGDRIKLARESIGITQQDLADLIGDGCRQSTIGGWEANRRGNIAININYISRASKVLGVNVNWLLTGEVNFDTSNNAEFMPIDQIGYVTLIAWNEIPLWESNKDDMRFKTYQKIPSFNQSEDDTNCYAVKVVTDTNEKFNFGDVLIVSMKKPKKGDHVIASIDAKNSKPRVYLYWINRKDEEILIENDSPNRIKKSTKIYGVIIAMQRNFL